MSVSETSKSPWGDTKRKRGSKFPVKREAVLSAAASLMRRKGYEGTSLAELADMLNITKPTLYYYVGSKEELFAEIIGRSQAETLAFMHSVVDSDKSGFEKLEAIMKQYVELTNSDFGACLMLSLPQNIGEIVLWRQIQARTREGNDLIYEVLAQGMKDGTIRAADPTIVLHALFGSLNWISRWFKPSGRLSLREVADLQVQVLLDGVRGNAGEAPARKAAGRRKSRGD